MLSVKTWPTATAHDGTMRALSVAAATVLLALCLGCGQDLDITPTPTPLRVILGGNPPEVTYESLMADYDKNNDELNEIVKGLIDAGYGFYEGDKKVWPWPVKTAYAKGLKEHERIQGELILRGWPSPTPRGTFTPTPTAIVWPTFSPPLLTWTSTPTPTREPR